MDDPSDISGSEVILTGRSSRYTATANPNGAGQAVTVTWTSSDPSVATVDASGLVTGRSHGSVALSASFQDGRAFASKTVSVVNDYGGDWNGTSVVRSCDQSADFDAQWWPQDDLVGRWPGCVTRVLKVSLGRLTHGGQNLSQVNGFLFDYSHPINDQGAFIPVAGEVSNDGRLILTGALLLSGTTEVKAGWRFGINGWDTRLDSPGRMVGRWGQDLTGPGGGRHHWESEIVLTRAGQ